MNNQELNPNAVGFTWFHPRESHICIVIFWDIVNKFMDCRIATVKGESQEEDIQFTMDFGDMFPVMIASNTIDLTGGWVKPGKLDWRPREETNSPLKLKLKYKGEIPNKKDLDVEDWNFFDN